MELFPIMPNERCPYFSMHVGTVPIAELQHPLRVPICRCALTEVFIQRLRAVPKGYAFASLLEAAPPDGQPHPVIGPDMQPITQATCTPERMYARCKPGFQDILSDFGADTTVPEPEPLL